MGVAAWKMFSSTGTANGSTEAIAMMDVPEDGDINAIDWAVEGNDVGMICGRVELSFASSTGLLTNDTRASISTMAYANAIAAAGGAGMFANKSVRLDPPIRVQGGDRLYMHVNNQGGAAWDSLRISCTIYANTKGVARARRL